MKVKYVLTLVVLGSVLSCADRRPSATGPASRSGAEAVVRGDAVTTSRPVDHERDGRLFPIQWVNRSEKLPPGVEHRTLHSPSMNREVGYCVYTPPGYAKSGKRYPVIYWLHGLPGNELLGVQHVPMLHQAIVEKQLPPMMMVIVNGGRGSMYCDSADGTIMPETMIIKELIPLIDREYRTITTRAGRAIEGFSMGGFGALKFAFKYPELFCSVVGGAPALIDWTRMSAREVIADRMFDGKAEAFESSHPAVLVRKNADRIRSKVRIRIVIGDQDGLKPYNDSLCAELDELGIGYEYEVVKGVSHSRGKVYEAVGLKGFQFQAASFAEGGQPGGS